MTSVVSCVRHYQKYIEKCAGDERRILKCLDKLHQLDVTVQHLQETGVGRTVNALRKEPGEVGLAARALVNKWKLMVANEEESEEDDQPENHNRDNGQDNADGSDENQPRDGGYYQSDHEESKPQAKVNGDCIDNRKRNNDSEDDNTSNKRIKPYTTSDQDKYALQPNIRKLNMKTEHLDSYETNDDMDNDNYSDADIPEDIHKIKMEAASDEEKDKYISKSIHSSREHTSRSKHRDGDSRSESPHSFSKAKSSESRHRSDDSKKRSDKSKHEKDNKKSHSSTEKDKRSEKFSSEKHKSTDKHRSSEKESTPPEKHKSSHGSVEKQKSSQNTSGKISESSSEKHKSSDKNSSTKDKSSSSERHRSSSHKEKGESSKSKHSESSSHSHKSKDEKKSLSSDKRKSSDKVKDDDKKSSTEDSKPKQSASYKSSSSSKNKDVPKKKHEAVDSDDGIGCESGASFAEALGMVSPVKQKKKSYEKEKTKESNSTVSPSSSYVNANATTDNGYFPVPASLLAPTTKLAPLPPLEISALPEISPNYKPRPPPKLLNHASEEEALNFVMSTKNQRTKVFSGNKTYGKMPSLYELCIQVIQENIDALEYTGGVPYEMLKPVVDKATPEQLFVLEHYNPYLMEDTDHLWRQHCERRFRNKKRQEMETWREMYMRCQEEQEARLKSLTANIKMAQEVRNAPTKQTKMAYVDSVVKPPRNIARKQAIHGTARAPVTSPAARVASLAGTGVVKPGIIRPLASTSAAAPFPKSSIKPKKAPLMMKTLQFIRGKKR